MKLGQQIIGLGLAGVLSALLLGGVGLVNTSLVSTAFSSSVDMGHALQKSQDADMMHDAIRGDVLLALLSAGNGDKTEQAQAHKDLAEHIETFNAAMAEMKKLPLPPEVSSTVAKAEPPLQAYLENARRVQQVAGGDKAQEQQAISEFQRSFKTLEVALEQQSEAISNAVHANSGEVLERVSQTRLQVSVLLVGVTCVLLFAAVWFTRQITAAMTQAIAVAGQIAQGNLATGVHPVGNEESRKLLTALGSMQSSFAATVGVVKRSAQNVALASVDIARSNQDLSSRTDSQAGALEKTALSMEQLNAQVNQNADSARQANQLAMSASSVAVQGGEVVGQVVQTMKGINDSSRRIGDIISVIDSIAFQTNILALNAAVEAARAGEQGRGFAVVASEVRSLAGRSADAAREIKSLINASVERVEQGAALVDKAGATMTEVVGAIRRVTDIMGEISAANNEQAASVSVVGQAVSQMDQSVQQNVALVEEMAVAADSLQNHARELVEAVSVFNVAPGQSADPVHRVAEPLKMAVRSPNPKGAPFKGQERRSAAART